MGRLEVPSIVEVVQLLGLRVDPRSNINAESFNVRCPFCGDKKYHMNINAKKGCYSCVKCCSGERGLGTLDLYGKVRFGTPHRKGSGGNGKELLISLLKELGRLDDDGRQKPVDTSRYQRQVPQAQEIPVASNKKLSAAYQFIFSYPAFRLSQQHRANLIRRGFDNETIDRNGYATMPENLDWLKDAKYKKYFQWFAEESLATVAAEHQRIRKHSREELVAGLALADEMRAAGIDLKGVPGAFMLGKHWCIYYQKGMLIPTRDRAGGIVGVQIRMDSGRLRYMTLSSKGLPKGPTANISKTHFPLGNAKPGPGVEALITEGPLKADLAVYLYGKPVFFMAVQGVNNTKELNGILRSLKLAGVVAVGSAFDMDKICNQNVRSSSKALASLVRNAGLQFSQKCWDVDCCMTKIQELEALCIQHGVKLTKGSDNPFFHLAYLADALYAAHIPYCVKAGKDGEEENDYWRDETKGIDDYLLYRRKQKKSEAA